MTNIDAPILLKTLKGPHTPTLSITHASHSAAQSITSIANTVQENIYGATENEALPNVTPPGARRD